MDKAGREILLEMTRRQFFGRTAKGIGVAALASLLGPSLMGEGLAVDPTRINRPVASRECRISRPKPSA